MSKNAFCLGTFPQYTDVADVVQVHYPVDEGDEQQRLLHEEVQGRMGICGRNAVHLVNIKLITLNSFKHT